VSSSPPPLPHLYAQKPSETNWDPERRSRLGLDWSPIVASLSIGFTVVVAAVAWILAHPRNAPAVSQTATEPLPVVSTQAFEPPVIAATPVLHLPTSPDAIVDRIPPMEKELPPLPPPPLPHPKPRAAPAQQPPPLPQPAPRSEEVEAAAPQRQGETYGTQVLFLNNRASAAETAKREHKLLFVMHISGNFEDSCFT
jgi:hypothetical protein